MYLRQFPWPEWRVYKTGVVIGKFYPPHRGHKFLVDTARSRVQHLTVIVCDKAGQSIPGALRAAWLREIHPEITVLCIDDIYPDDDSLLWARLTVSWLGYVPDAVFTSEEYGARYAQLMGAAHVLVDQARRHVPCSGTLVRGNPFAYWDYLAPCVRAYFVKRVCVVGAESTGKTTLAQALGPAFRTIWVPEYGREYSEIKLRGPNGSDWRSEEFTEIAAEQSRREDAAAREANGLLICDTDAFATSIWHERYLRARSPEVEAIAASRRYDLYLLTGIEIPFVQDGTRDGEHIRHWMHERFLEELAIRHQPFALISGSPEERLAAATHLIETRVLTASLPGGIPNSPSA